MSKRFVDYNPYTRTTTWHYYDAATDTTHIQYVQDCQNIIERNKALANTIGYADHGKKTDMFHFATIPNSVVLEFKKKFNLDIYRREDLPKIERIITRDPEYRYLRTF